MLVVLTVIKYVELTHCIRMFVKQTLSHRSHSMSYGSLPEGIWYGHEYIRGYGKV